MGEGEREENCLIERVREERAFESFCTGRFESVKVYA